MWLKPPGWRPADVAARWPKPAFDLRRLRRYDPRITEQAAWVAATLFAVVLLLTTIFLWNAHRLAPWLTVVLAAGIVALLWAVGAITEPAGDVDDADVAPDTVPETAHPRP